MRVHWRASAVRMDLDEQLSNRFSAQPVAEFCQLARRPGDALLASEAHGTAQPRVIAVNRVNAIAPVNTFGGGVHCRIHYLYKAFLEPRGLSRVLVGSFGGIKTPGKSVYCF